MYFAVLLWSLVIFASFWGYGEALRRALKRPEFDDLGWGLTAAWGMAVTLAIGGFLMMLSLAKAPILTGVVLLGAALGLYFVSEFLTLTPASKKPSKKQKTVAGRRGRVYDAADLKKAELSGVGQISYPILVSHIVLWSVAILAFASSVAWPHQIDPNDDWIAYLMYPEKILQTGTLIDPFSLRRIAALGGQSFLQAIVMIVGEPENGHLLDRGFGALLLLGLMLQATRDVPKNLWIIRFIIIFTSTAVAVPRIHTGSHLLGFCLLLALVITFSRLLNIQKWSLSACIPVAMVLAGASTLRPMFAMVGGGLIVFYFVLSSFQPAERNRMAAWLSLLAIGGLTFTLIIPYMILSWKSSGTPMFPFSSGYGNSQMMFGGLKETGWVNWAAALKFISFPEIAAMAVGLVVVGILQEKQRLLGIAAALSGFGMVFLSAFKMSAADVYDVYRYTFPLVAFPLFWILARATATIRKRWSYIGPAMAGVAGSLVLAVHFPSIASEFRAEVLSLPIQMEGFKFQVAQLEPSYRQLQNLVPAGEKIFTIVDAPYLLDFERNPIDNIDSIGGASLPPGMPFEQGPDALKRYFLSLGYRYIICVDFDNAVLLYTRKLWENHPRKEWYFKEVWGKYALDFMGNLDNIADWHTKAKAGNCRLIEIN